MNRTAMAVLCILALVSLCPTAHAGEPPSAATNDITVNEHDGDAVYARARRKVKAGDWEGALLDYRRVYALKKERLDWQEAANHAVAAERLGHAAEAAHMFRHAQQHMSPVDPLYKEYSVKIANRRRALDKVVGTIALSITPTGSEVLLNDEQRGRSPIQPIYAASGTHKVTVQLANYRTVSRQLKVTPDETVALQIDLSLKALTPGAAASADGDGLMTGLGIAGLALGGAAVIAGVGLWVAAADQFDEAETQRNALLASLQAPLLHQCGQGTWVPAPCEALSDSEGSALALRAWSIGSFVAGGALATAGLIALIVPTADNGEGDNVKVSVGPASISLRGSW